MAIDLGTARTAFSWKSVLDPTPRVGVPENTDGVLTAKSPTAILMAGTIGEGKVFQPKEVLAFGNAAEEQFADSTRGQLFKRFKMVSRLCSLSMHVGY